MVFAEYFLPVDDLVRILEGIFLHLFMIYFSILIGFFFIGLLLFRSHLLPSICHDLRQYFSLDLRILSKFF